MSWSVYAKGQKRAVAAKVTQDLGNAAKAYAGTPEGESVEQALRSILAAIDGLRLDADAVTPGGYCVNVEANGSWSNGYATTNFKVERIVVLFDQVVLD